MQIEKLLRSSTLLWIFCFLGLLNTFFMLSPQLQSGYYWDDEVLSTVRGAAKLHGTGLWGMMKIGITEMLREQARFIPIAALSYVPHYFFDRFYYKLSILILILGNLWLFSLLLKKITRSATFQTFILLISPAFFQLRSGPDAIFGYHWVLQLVFLFTLLSLILYIDFLKSGNRVQYIVSLFSSLFAVFTYEISYLFPLFHLGLAITTSRSNRKRAIFTALPYFGVTALAVSTLILIRWSIGGEAPKIEIIKTAFTLLKHCSASIPGAFSFFAGLRSEEQWTIFNSGQAYKILFTPITAWIIINQITALVMLFKIYGLNQNDECVGFRQAWTISLLVLVIPGTMMSVVQKYQDPFWVDWGMSYLPIYISFHGMLALLALTTWQLVQWIKIPYKRIIIIVIVSILVGSISIINYSNVFLITKFLNADYRYPREVLENSIQRGLFKEVKPGAVLINDSLGYRDWHLSFYMAYQSVPLAKISTRGNYLREDRYPGDHLAKIFFGTDDGYSFISSNVAVSVNADMKSFDLTPEDKVYYLRAQADEKTEYVIFALLKHLRTSNKKLELATSESVYIYIQGLERQHDAVIGNWYSDKTFSPSAITRIPVFELERISHGNNWSLYRLPKMKGAEITELTTLQVGAIQY